jgi:hypothetical protein
MHSAVHQSKASSLIGTGNLLRSDIKTSTTPIRCRQIAPNNSTEASLLPRGFVAWLAAWAVSPGGSFSHHHTHAVDISFMSLGLGTPVLAVTAEFGSEMAAFMATQLDGGVESSLDVCVFHDEELLWLNESFT